VTPTRGPYLAFADEAHGFHEAASQIQAREAELSFYGEMFGFTPARRAGIGALAARRLTLGASGRLRVSDGLGCVVGQGFQPIPVLPTKVFGGVSASEVIEQNLTQLFL
jgi:hypothetical protein